jgi:hypothetical protein
MDIADSRNLKSGPLGGDAKVELNVAIATTNDGKYGKRKPIKERD